MFLYVRGSVEGATKALKGSGERCGHVRIWGFPHKEDPWDVFLECIDEKKANSDVIWRKPW